MRPSKAMGISAAHSELRRLLKSWLKVAKRYGAWWKWNDCFWFYSERPAISILAGAVWDLKGVALEEFGSGKKCREKGDYRGRCDISFRISRNSAYSAEAKHVWCKIDKDPGKAIEKVQNNLQAACEDVTRWRNSHQKLAIVFVSFVTSGTGIDKEPPPKNQKAANKLRPTWMPAFISQLRNHRDLHFAWYTCSNKVKDCPGAAIIIKRC
jgi:hypothetical protein